MDFASPLPDRIDRHPVSSSQQLATRAPPRARSNRVNASPQLRFSLRGKQRGTPRANIERYDESAHRGHPCGRRGQAHALGASQGAPSPVRSAAHRLSGARRPRPRRPDRRGGRPAADDVRARCRPSSRRAAAASSSRRSASAPGTPLLQAHEAVGDGAGRPGAPRRHAAPVRGHPRVGSSTTIARPAPPDTLLTAVVADPTGYGRVVREQGRPVAIVEHRDATAAQRQRPRDRHQRLLLRRPAALARARPGDARERAGRVLPHRRDRASCSGRARTSRR